MRARWDEKEPMFVHALGRFWQGFSNCNSVLLFLCTYRIQAMIPLPLISCLAVDHLRPLMFSRDISL
jgi:hypothetical protein